MPIIYDLGDLQLVQSFWRKKNRWVRKKANGKTFSIAPRVELHMLQYIYDIQGTHCTREEVEFLTALIMMEFMNAVVDERAGDREMFLELHRGEHIAEALKVFRDTVSPRTSVS